MSETFADLPLGHYRAILADPPWRYSVFSPKGEARSASQHYSTMSIDQICALPVASLAAPDCHLFLWTTGPNLQQSFAAIEEWGFRFSAMAFVWVKMKGLTGRLFVEESDAHIGMGHTTRHNAEFCLLGRRGSPTRKSKAVRELMFEARREHSRKPDETYARIEAYCAGPYLEMFARQQRAGWDAWGNQTEKFKAAP